MNKNYKLALKYSKYSLFVVSTLILVLLWKVVFILQGGIGLDGNIFLLPFKLLPILVYSAISFWLILKMFDYKGRVKQRSKMAFAVGVFSLVLSVLFQHFVISKRIAPFNFKNKMFSHVGLIEMNADFNNRLMISAAEYLRLFPLGSRNNEFASFLSNIAAEAALVFEVKKRFNDKRIEFSCKEYIKKFGDYGNCISDYQKDIYSQTKFTSTGTILMVALGALGTFKVKQSLTKKYGKANSYVAMRAANDLIEISMLSLESSKEIINNEDGVINFSMGYKMHPSSDFRTIEQQIHYKHLLVAIGKLESIVSRIEKKILKRRDKCLKREISSLARSELEREEIRFENMRTKFRAFQEGGFKIEELKERQEKVEVKLKRIKEIKPIFSFL